MLPVSANPRARTSKRGGRNRANARTTGTKYDAKPGSPGMAFRTRTTSGPKPKPTLVCGEYFVNSVGFGFGPEVVRVRNAMPGLPGFASYSVPVVRAFARFRPPRFEVRARGFAETGNMMMVEVCNGTTAGGSYRFAPDALPGDGRLDVCLVRRVSLLRFLMAVPRVMRGTHATMREVALFQTRQVTIRSLDGPLLLHMDGELREIGRAH